MWGPRHGRDGLISGTGGIDAWEGRASWHGQRHFVLLNLCFAQFFGFKFFFLFFFPFFFAMLDIASVKTPPRLAALGWLSPPVCVISVFAEHVSFHNIARITRGGKSRAVDSAGRVAGMLCLRFKGKTGLFRDFGFHGKTKMLYVQVSKR